MLAIQGSSYFGQLLKVSNRVNVCLWVHHKSKIIKVELDNLIYINSNKAKPKMLGNVSNKLLATD